MIGRVVIGVGRGLAFRILLCAQLACGVIGRDPLLSARADFLLQPVQVVIDKLGRMPIGIRQEAQIPCPIIPGRRGLRQRIFDGGEAGYDAGLSTSSAGLTRIDSGLFE